VLPAGIEEAFVGHAGGTYHPHIFASVTLHYVRASHGLDAWDEQTIVAPLTPELSWEAAELLPPGTDLRTDPPPEADFVAPPSGAIGKARFRSYEKQLKTHMYQTQPKTLWRCKELKLVSTPDETKREFAARVQLAAREERDAAVEALRERYAKEVERVEERKRRAEERLERERSQYDQQKLQTSISMGATVLGAIFGRGGIGRATTAARGASRVAREREDVIRAEDALEELRQTHKDLEIEVEEELRAFRAEQERREPTIEAVIVRPRKSDIQVSGLRLLWRQR
jgi:hypothetical protein